MKIEIDFSRPDELRKTKRELELALVTIDGVLAQLGKNSHNPSQIIFSQISSPAPSVESDVASIISSLPEHFNMKEAMALVDGAKMPHSKFRREVARMTGSGALVMIEKGQGRRPATFRKA